MLRPDSTGAACESPSEPKPHCSVRPSGAKLEPKTWSSVADAALLLRGTTAESCGSTDSSKYVSEANVVGAASVEMVTAPGWRFGAATAVHESWVPPASGTAATSTSLMMQCGCSRSR